MNRALMTPAGFEMLRKELQRYKHEERPANIKAIEEAIAHGDLSENAEYDYAKNQQGIIAAKINELESTLATAEVIDPTKMSGDRVAFGATVSLVDVDTEEELRYKIVGVHEADVKKGKISFISPIARALMGKNVDDSVVVKVPKGSRELEVTDIQWI